MVDNGNATCPRCGERFECKSADISNCHCSSISLSPAQYFHISSNWQQCLCHDCLVQIQGMSEEALLGAGISGP